MSETIAPVYSTVVFKRQKYKMHLFNLIIQIILVNK